MFSCLGKVLGRDQLSAGPLVCRAWTRLVAKLVGVDDKYTAHGRPFIYHCLYILGLDRSD